jgi:hypothetical protein
LALHVARQLWRGAYRVPAAPSPLTMESGRT